MTEPKVRPGLQEIDKRKPRGPINVLVVDDSAVVRQVMTSILTQESDMNVTTASDPIIAIEKMKQFHPDVILLDLEMPRMDGITFLKWVMAEHPLPVIICSSLAENGSEGAFRALEAGALEIVAKPKLGVRDFLYESAVVFIDAVRAAARAKIIQIGKFKPVITQPKLTADAILPPVDRPFLTRTTDKVIAIGASTGGTEALRIVLEAMPPEIPGIVVVQHMPEHFTRGFAERLNQLCRIEVKEAEDGDRILSGRALIAPGNKHTLVKRSGGHYIVEVVDGPLVTRHRPSVNVLFRSMAGAVGANALGVIMTGMGDDGAKGLLEMKKGGAVTIAQDEASCVVFGMPREAILLGAVEEVVSLPKISNVILSKIHKL